MSLLISVTTTAGTQSRAEKSIHWPHCYLIRPLTTEMPFGGIERSFARIVQRYRYKAILGESCLNMRIQKISRGTDDHQRPFASSRNRQ